MIALPVIMGLLGLYLAVLGFAVYRVCKEWGKDEKERAGEAGRED